MDTRTLCNRISDNLGFESSKTKTLLEAFVKTVNTAVLEGDSVAIPSFGTFSAIKVDEEIVTDRSTGKRMLLPPQISYIFTPAAMLRKKIFNNESDN